jgi:cytochrome P450 PksS
MLALWQHPEQLALLKAQPALMSTAVEEFLRYDGSVERAFNRFVLNDVALGETAVPQGQLIIPILAAANRDPAVFENPEELDVTRSPNPHLGFGKGPHYCLGAPLARMEAEIGLNTLLQRLPGLQTAVPLAELRWRLMPGFRSLTALPVRW